MSPDVKAMIASWIKVFLSAVLTAMGSGDWYWQTLLFAGLVAVLPVIKNWLDESDPRYGKGYVPPVAE
jgi:membrane protein implicated in regulation of membrane protease activity